ncbi:MAG: hypothetical protein ABIH23_29065 [bacterium]
MTRFKTDRDLVFAGDDLVRPRMTVEKEKLKQRFPGFEFYAKGGEVIAIKGWLNTNYGWRYKVRIDIPSDYPYSMPDISIVSQTIDSDCSHAYSDRDICVMKSDQWSSSLSLSFIVAKTALWLNKYDVWRRNGKKRWPGTDQHR